MTQVKYDAEGLHVQFPGWEAAMAGRSNFTASHDDVRSARMEPGWSSEILGYRSGLVVSGFRKLGVFTHPTGVKRLVSMKRGLPLLRVEVTRATTGFDELLISVANADEIAAMLDGGVRR